MIADDAGVGTSIYWLPAAGFACGSFEWIKAGLFTHSSQAQPPDPSSHRILDEPGHAPVLALLGLVAGDISVPVSMPARDARLARIFGTLPAQSQFERMEPRQVFAREEMVWRALGLGHRHPAGLPLAGRRDGAQLRSRLPPQLNWRSYRISKCLDLCQSDAQPSCIKLK